MRVETLTEDAHGAVTNAQELVWEHQQAMLDVDHLLLALLREPNGLAGQVLTHLGVDAHVVIQQVEQDLAQAPRTLIPRGSGSQIYVTPRFQRLIKRAEATASHQSDASIDIQHLLLALSSEDGGTFASCLEPFNITTEQMQQAIKQVAGTQSS